MQMVNGQPLNQLTHSHNTLLSPSHLNNGPDDGIIVGFLISAVSAACNQLLNHIGKFLGQGLANLGAGVFAGCAFADLNQTVQGNFVPVFPVVYGF